MTGARFIVLLMAALSVSMAYGVTLPGVPLISMQFATVSTFNAHKGYFK